MRRKSLSDLARDWWVMGLRGLAALVAGVIILATSFPYLANLLRVFGGYMLIDGLIVLILTAIEVRHGKSWAKSALNGLLGIAFGITNLIGSGPVTLRADFIALRTLISGISTIIAARQLHVTPSEFLLGWLLTMAGFGSVLFGLMIWIGPSLLVPLLAGYLLDELGWIVVLYTFIFGSLLLAISVWLFKINQKEAPAATA